MRLVPSLRGTLYSLSGETIEPLPFDAEQLLSASYKYSDDLVIAGKIVFLCFSFSSMFWYKFLWKVRKSSYVRKVINCFVRNLFSCLYLFIYLFYADRNRNEISNPLF